MDSIVLNVLKDICVTDLLADLLGDAASSEVYNLLLETGDDYLLEDNGYILLE
jgi:hypothetical protein